MFGTKCPDNEQQSDGTDYSMYDEGWNMICYTANTQWEFTNFNHFQTPPNTDTATKFPYYPKEKLMFGAALSSNKLQSEFEGIIHSVRIISSAYSAATIESTWLRPIHNQAVICDYFISYFNDLGTVGGGGNFKNSMFNYNGHSQTFVNSLGSTVDATNGLSFTNGDVQKIFSVRFHRF